MNLADSKELGAPDWYDFEHKIWAIGEDIKQIMVKHPDLRKDKELQINCDGFKVVYQPLTV